MSPASRIVIDPEEVRRIATRMRGGAFVLASSGRTLALGPLPPMPAGVAAHVSEAICDANAALQDLAVELIEDAAQLEARASWAELGGGREVAWLIPGLRRYGGAPTTAGGELPAVTEEQIRARQGWAVEILDEMEESAREPDVGVDGVGAQADDGFGDDLVDMLEAAVDQMAVRALGGFTLLAAGAPDVGEHGHEAPVMSAGGGALGAGIGMLYPSPTGWGIVGCLLAGGLIEPSEVLPDEG